MKFTDICFLTTMTSILMLDIVYLNNTQSLKIALQENKTHVFSRETSFIKESSLTKYHCIKSELTIFVKISYVFSYN